MIEHIGYDSAPFNIEFYYESRSDEAQLAERLRICQSLLPFGIDPVGRRASA